MADLLDIIVPVDPLTKIEEADLVAKYRAGDNSACQTLIQSQIKWLTAACNRITAKSPGVTSEDLVSEMMPHIIEALKDPARFNPERSRLSNYLYRMASRIGERLIELTNSPFNHFVEEGTEVSSVEYLMSVMADNELTEESTAEETANLNELTEIVRAVVADLPEDAETIAMSIMYDERETPSLKHAAKTANRRSEFASRVAEAMKVRLEKEIKDAGLEIDEVF